MTPQKILCVGGGTAGSMIPLVSLLQWRARLNPNTPVEVFWIGTKKNLEENYLPNNLKGYASISTSKLHRHWDWRNALLPFTLSVAFVQSLWHCLCIRPDVVWTAGGFTAVPVAWAARLLGISVVSIQQDIERGLANRFIERVATSRYTTIPPSVFPTGTYTAYQYIGLLTRFSSTRSQPKANSTALPVVLILGGSSGAHALNTIVWKSLPYFENSIEMIHSVGPHAQVPNNLPKWYHAQNVIINELEESYQRATVVVSRCGMNVIAECAVFAKSVIVVPLPNTHQEVNALWLQQQGAVQTLHQQSLTPEQFAQAILALLKDTNKQQQLSKTLHTLLPQATQASVKKVFKHK